MSRTLNHAKRLGNLPGGDVTFAAPTKRFFKRKLARKERRRLSREVRAEAFQSYEDTGWEALDRAIAAEVWEDLQEDFDPLDFYEEPYEDDQCFIFEEPYDYEIYPDDYHNHSPVCPYCGSNL